MDKIVRSKNLTFDGARISIYRDYPAEVAKKLNAFRETKRILRELIDLRYTLRYPATLRVTHDNQDHFFKNPQNALDFVQRIKNQEED